MTTPILHQKCPICGKNAVLEYKPFCCKKCADIDLGHWLNESYVMHTNEVPTEAEFNTQINPKEAE